MISILVVSEYELTGSALKHLLLSENGFTVIGVHSLRRAARLIEKKRPDVVLLHAAGPTNPIEMFVSSAISAVPDTRILVIGRAPTDRDLQAVLAAGAAGFLLVKSTPGQLFDAIRSVASGERVIDPGLTHQLITMALKEEPPAGERLSSRERQVLRMIAYGHTVKEIAAALSISSKSVETYLARLREKLHLRTRAEIVRYALRLGLFSDTTDKRGLH